MLSKFLLPALFLLTLYLVAVTIHTFLENRRHAKKALEMGCKPARMMRTRLPLGVDYLMRLVRWDNDNLLPPFTYQLFKEIGAPTWEQSFLGVNALATVDPKNIQAVLATQFKDFSLGSTRRGNFYPLLGNGIFTNDGKEWYVNETMAESVPVD